MTLKQCGHDHCSLVNRESCCACLDQRPYSKSYSRYIDGGGTISIPDIKERYRGYCPDCRNAIVGPLSLPWDIDSSTAVRLKNDSRQKSKMASRKERRAAHQKMMAKKQENSTMVSIEANKVLLQYNHGYRQETELNSRKLFSVRESRSYFAAGPSASPECRTDLPYKDTDQQKTNEKSHVTESKGFIPSASLSELEPHNPFSIWRNKPRIRFPSWSLHSFHHKKPDHIVPTTSTSAAEPPNYDPSDPPDSAPPPYTPFASDGTRIIAMHEKARG
jgi:hypothetical protein